jgi:sulfite reductase (NADPH) flavoprotein alpha-component
VRLVGITLARRGHTRSIASSPKKTTGEIHLAVAVVRYRLRDRERGGVASTFLSDRLSRGGAGVRQSGR